MVSKTRLQRLPGPPPLRRPGGPLWLCTGLLALCLACSWVSAIVRCGVRVSTAHPPGRWPIAFLAAAGDPEAAPKDGAPADAGLGTELPVDGPLLCTATLVATAAFCYMCSWQSAQSLQAKEAQAAEAPPSEQPKKKPRIDSFDSLRFFLIFYISSGHFIHTATKNEFLLRLVTQINVVVGAFFVLSGYVAAYTTTELGERKGSKRLDNAVEFAVSRIMGFWPLHFLVLVLFSPMFYWVDVGYSGLAVAVWHNFISAFMLQAWFPQSAEVWNAPTWFLSAFAFALWVLPYALRILATQRRAELRRTLVFLTLLSLMPKVGYCYDLNTWGILEGVLNAKTHPNYALFNSIRFSPFGAVLEVLMGAAACRLVMLDADSDSGKTGSPVWPLIAMVGIVILRGAGAVTMNDLLARAVFFIPLWIVFLMRIHRQSVGPGGAQKILPKVLCKRVLLFLGGVSFPIFIVHGPIGQVFYKKAVASKLFGSFKPSQPSHTGIHWFFGVYWAAVIFAAILLQKGFVENRKVKEVSAKIQGAVIKALTT